MFSFSYSWDFHLLFGSFNVLQWLLIHFVQGTVKDGKASDSISPIPSIVGAENGVKGGVDQGAAPEQGAYYSLASCCDYYYPGKILYWFWLFLCTFRFNEAHILEE